MNEEKDLFSEAFNKISAAKRILLISDGKADGDSIGSTTAFYHWLIQEKKELTVFSAEKIPSILRFLDGIHQFTHDQNCIKNAYDLIITFDASDPVRCGLLNKATDTTPDKPHVIVFDHHATNPRYGHTNIVLTDACSTCEVVYRFLQHNKININTQIATSLLTGIITDTGSFSNSGTTTIGLEAAAHALKCGARYRDIVDNIIKNKQTSHLKILGLALARLTHDQNLDMAYTYLCKADIEAIPNGEEAAEGISNIINAYCGEVGCILVLRELENEKIKGSLRSISRDISTIAQKFGGGGHKKAAGFVTHGKLTNEEDVKSFINQLGAS